MKKVLVPVLISSFFFATGAFAKATVGVIDVQKVLDTVKDSKKAQEKLKKIAARMQAQFKQKQAKLQKDYQEVQKRLSLMAPQERQQKAKEFDQRLMALQKEAAQLTQQLEQEKAKLMKPILNKIKKVTAKVAKQKGLTLIIEKSATVFTDPAVEITDQVIKEYEKQ